MKRPTDPRELHSAGAVVRHPSRFSDLPTPEPAIADGDLPGWARRLFNVGLFDTRDAVAVVGADMPRVTVELAQTLLATFDWRPRIIGSHLSAIKMFRSLECHIGNLLLRSDVCYAGAAYSLCLARFNTDASREFLVEYLRYYLRKPDLWFDQGEAMAAILVLDARNRTSFGEPLRPLWNAFIRNKPSWRLESFVQRTVRSLDELEATGLGG